MKIGFTGRPVRTRMAEGQTFAHQELTLLAETYGTLADEAKLHRVFSEHRVRGEWFNQNPLLRDLVMHLTEGGSLQHWLEGNNV